MASDLAIDWNTGDLVISPTKDLSLRTGQGVVDQRIRVRLRIPYGSWDINPSLGSRLPDMHRMPDSRARQTAELVVREALEPMTDIVVQDVHVESDLEDQRVVNILISYSMVDDEEGVETLTTTATVEVGE
jgi:hypothetical protein